MGKKISIIIPIYNESSNIYPLYEALCPLINNQMMSEEYDWELIMIDDGSKDGSCSLMMQLHEKDKRIKAVRLSRNFGKEAAMLAGFDLVTGDATVILDADLQHPINIIPEMIKLWEEGYDDIYGKRRNRHTDSFMRRIYTNLYYKTIKKFSKKETLDDAGDFRLLSARLVNILCKMKESQRYTKNLFEWIGYRKTFVECDYSQRRSGKSSFSLGKLINFAIEGITSNTTAPLRFSFIGGIISLCAALIYLILSIIMSCLDVLVFLIVFFGGIQLLALGIIGEYLARVFVETKNRPVYLIDSINGEPYNVI